MLVPFHFWQHPLQALHRHSPLMIYTDIWKTSDELTRTVPTWFSSFCAQHPSNLLLSETWSLLSPTVKVEKNNYKFICIKLKKIDYFYLCNFLFNYLFQVVRLKDVLFLLKTLTVKNFYSLYLLLLICSLWFQTFFKTDI